MQSYLFPSFGFYNTGGGGSGSTPSWQQVTTVGNTTTDDIFVKDGSANEYLTVDKTNNIYYLGNPVSGRAISINAATQAYLFGESAGVNIAIDGSGGTITFAGTNTYRFSNSIASYASGLYSSVVLNATASPAVIEIQPKDMVPINATAKTANYNATANDCVLLIDSTSSAVAITLPAAALVAGKRFFVKWISGANAATVRVQGGALIDGSATYTFVSLNQSAELVFDGTNYYVL